MVEWRARGVVQDSDEEDDFEDVSTTDVEDVAEDRKKAYTNLQETTNTERGVSECHQKEDEPLSSATNPHADDDFDELQDDPVYALPPKLLTPILNEASQENPRAIPTQRTAQDIPSSSLSEPPKTPPLRPFDILPAPTSARLQPVVVIPSPTATSASPLPDQQVPHVDRYGRQLRRRNPIQLHPYVLENEQYRQTFRARGLRPVALANEDSQLEAEKTAIHNEDSQFTQSSQSSPLMGPSSQTSPSSSASALPGLDDDLPDLATLLQLGSAANIHTGQKRKRKPIYQTIRNGGVDQKMYTLGGSALEDTLSIFDIPSSPPQTTFGKPRVIKHRYKRFRVPRGVEQSHQPTHLPTPEPSSDVNKALDEFLRLESGSDNEVSSPVNLQTPAVSTRISRDVFIGATTPRRVEVSSSESSSDSEVERTRLARQARKFRGVLPASYLRVDQQVKQKQAIVVPDDFGSVTQSPTAIRRGIAKRVNTFNRAEGLPSVPQAIEISDESDAQTDAVENHPNAPQHRLGDSRHESLIDNFGDVEEDDWIDPMLPGHTRARNFTSTKRKRQVRLTDTFQPAKKRALGLAQSRTPTSHSRSGKTSKAKSISARRNPKLKSSAPRRSVLDAVGLTGDTQKPDFLKLAIRQAKSRPDKGRHSPSRKAISMQDRVQGAEVDAVLRAWKHGDVKRVKRSEKNDQSNSRPASRQPLASRWHNQQTLRVLVSSRSNVRSRGMAMINLTSTVTEAKRKAGRQSRLEYSPVDREQITPLAQVEPTTQKHVENTARKLPTKARRLNVRDRPGQLEGAESDVESSSERPAHRSTLQALNAIEAQKAPSVNPLLERYLAEDESTVPRTNQQRTTNDRHEQVSERYGRTATISSAKVRRAKKRPPKWVDLSVIDQHQFQDEDVLPEVPRSSTTVLPDTSAEFIRGLGPFGTVYSTTFDVGPFAVGTFFHETTFIGNGQLRKTLQPTVRDMDESYGSIDISFQGVDTACGSWTLELAALVDNIVSAAGQLQTHSTHRAHAQSADLTVNFEAANVLSALQSVLQVYMQSLSFSDPVDRQSCISSTVSTLSRALNDLSTADVKTSLARMLLLMALLAFRLSNIANHPLVQQDLSQKCKHLVKSFSTQCLAMFKSRSVELQRLSSDMKQSKRQEGGICNNEPIAEVVVSLILLAETVTPEIFDFWPAFNDVRSERISNECFDVSNTENVWNDIFVILPYFEFDSDGIIEKGKRFRTLADNWALVKVIMESLYTAYDHAPARQIPSMNAYFRANLMRCFNLIRHWGWQKSEVILGSVFDYFGRRGFSFLSNEEVHDSPAFLVTLDKDSLPSLDPGDRSFHIFLKMLRLGLVRMQKSYTLKKLGNIAWRFIPNHDRNHKKDESLKQEDLEALRNHHDLLVVLYCSLPETARPNTNLIRKLVDFQSSHSEVCRLNVRAWANLVNFHLRNDDDPSVIEPFVAWFNETVTQIIDQHHLAQAEGDTLAQSIGGGAHNTHDRMIESMVSRNQLQLEGLLTTLLAALITALKEAKNVPVAIALFKGCAIPQVLQLFNPKQSRINNVVELALDVYQTFVGLTFRQTPLTVQPETQTSEDSQDYGDWPDDMELTELDTGRGQSLVDASTVDPIWMLISNCFGTDKSVADTLVMKMIKVWVDMAKVLVQTGQRDWNYYLGQHGPGSWAQLRKTDRNRQYLPFYLSTIIEQDSRVFEYDSTGFVSAWLCSLVERDASLKFQHRLTTALLNANVNNPLLRNPPFVKIASTGTFEITMDMLRQRRLALISTVLENMRNAYDDAVFGSSDAAQIKSEYVQILKALLLAMKTNYQELQLGTSLRGAYIEFVQKLVEFMQQYTVEICLIDKFFIDSAAFPLPTTDPTYVVGRLKGYGRRLADAKTQKKLVVFLQTVCERAALEGQQAYLIDQLTRSVEGLFEKDASQLSLRRVLLEAILPGYLEIMFAHDCGWILALPLLEAVKIMTPKLIFNYNLNSAGGVLSMFETCIVVLQSITSTMVSLHIRLPGILKEPCTLKTLALFYDICTAVTTPLNYALRFFKVESQSQAVLKHIALLVEYATYMTTQLEQADDQNRHEFNDRRTPATPIPSPAILLGETRSFCAKELRETLTRNWIRQGDIYSVMRGTCRSQVAAINVGSWEEEKERVLKSVTAFLDVRGGMALMGGCCGRLRRMGRMSVRGDGVNNNDRAELWV